MHDIPAADALEQIVGHLGAAKIQRVPTDDRIIAGHIDAALELALMLWKAERHQLRGGSC